VTASAFLSLHPAVVLLCLATAVLFYLTVMDWRFFLLPNKGNLALAILGLAFQSLAVDWSDVASIQGMLSFMAGGAVAGAGIFLLTRWLSLKWKGVEGIGWGDVKFAAAAGIWLGPAGVGFMIAGGAFLLVLVGFTNVLFKRRQLKDYYLPFGAAAAPVTIAFLWLRYLGYLSF
jgi:leader peptidase (prepilin peptidase)/N-methyltransferase